jgi:DNA-binding MarR family transcriptional regulator
VSLAQCNTWTMDDIPGDDDLAVFLRATRIFAALAERSAESVGLTLAQMRLLFTLSDLEAASCTAVAAKLHLSVSSITRLVARPVMSPLVLRGVSPTNASALELTLTDEGLAKVRRVTASRERLLRAALAGIDPKTASIVACGLKRVIDDLDEVMAS